jgi:rRNA maturation endonuclease Nob1
MNKKISSKADKKIRKEIECREKCTECDEIYQPASPHADIRCANCGCHQKKIKI